MGIPRLRQLLQPFGEVADFKNSDNAKERLVIDGPAFAHFIYWRLFNHQNHALGVFDAQPSYNQIGQACVDFLVKMEDQGPLVHRIYFDGYLPEAKIPTRTSRLQSSVTTLKKFRASHDSQGSNTLLNGSHAKILWPLLLFVEKSCPVELRGSPSPPFLVPAVIEALSQSKYGSLTALVPGEAEAYCARDVQQSGGMLLTSDSDTLLFDLGPKGSVSFLNDLMVLDYQGIDERLRASIFKPKKIAIRLCVPDTSSIARILSEHPSWSLQQILGYLGKAKPVEVPGGRVCSLCNAELAHTEQALFNKKSLKYYKKFHHLLDPRLSEFVLDLAMKNSDSAMVFMLPLAEDVRRRAAWEDSRHIREIAYWCLVYRYSRPDTLNAVRSVEVSEYARKGDRIVETSWDMARDQADHYDALAVELKAELDHLDSHLPRSTTTSDTMFRWRAFASRQLAIRDKEQNPDSGRSCCSNCTAHLIHGGDSSSWTWKDIHLHARIEAYLYSLRILYQALCYTECVRGAVRFPDGILDLRVAVSWIPSIDLLCPTRWQLEEAAIKGDCQYTIKEISHYISCVNSGLATNNPGGDSDVRMRD